jgi:hypothetical protein
MVYYILLFYLNYGLIYTIAHKYIVITNIIELH